MNQALKLVENYVMRRVMDGHGPLNHTNKSVLTLSVLSGLFGLIAICFILSGVFLWLLQNTSMHEAYIIFGFILMIISVLAFGIIGYIEYKKNQKLEVTKDYIRDEILLNLKLAQAELNDLKILENHPKTCVALASIAGFLLSEKTL